MRTSEGGAALAQACGCTVGPLDIENITLHMPTFAACNLSNCDFEIIFGVRHPVDCERTVAWLPSGNLVVPFLQTEFDGEHEWCVFRLTSLGGLSCGPIIGDPGCDSEWQAALACFCEDGPIKVEVRIRRNDADTGVRIEWTIWTSVKMTGFANGWSNVNVGMDCDTPVDCECEFHVPVHLATGAHELTDAEITGGDPPYDAMPANLNESCAESQFTCYRSISGNRFMGRVGRIINNTKLRFTPGP